MSFSHGTKGEARESLGINDHPQAVTEACEETRTLNRAAHDFAAKEPRFSLGIANASLEWMALGYGHEITHGDVIMAYDEGIKAAQLLGMEVEMKQAVSDLIARRGPEGLLCAARWTIGEIADLPSSRDA